MNLLGEYVECQGCSNTFQKEVLDYDPEAGAEAFQAEYQRAVKRVMVGMLLAYLARVRSWRALTFIAFTLPIALLANLARVVVLIMLVAAFDSDILGTLAHPLSGVGTFVLALGMLMAVEKWLMPSRKGVPA